jgi:hypothetical protein
MDCIYKWHLLSLSNYFHLEIDLIHLYILFLVVQIFPNPYYGEVPDYSAYVALLPQQNRGLALLINANEQLYTYAFLDMGEVCAKLIAGDSPHSDSWWFLPWVLRAQLLSFRYSGYGSIYAAFQSGSRKHHAYQVLYNYCGFI